MLVVFRLCLALLLAIAATPVAACDDAHAGVAGMPVMAGMAHSSRHVPEQRRHDAIPHACIGCIPPSDWQARDVIAPPLAPVPARIAPRIAQLAGRGTPPALPPPRLG